MRANLESAVSGYARATLLPEETISVAGHDYRCYVVRVTDSDTRDKQDKDVHFDKMFWIDKAALVLRKQIVHTSSYAFVTQTIHVPLALTITTIYPVAEFNAEIDPAIFRFAPPAGATQVETFEPNFGSSSMAFPKSPMLGQLAPEVSFAASDKEKISLSSLRGKPLLLDFWATWCGSCLLSMPSFERIYEQVKDKGITVLSFDQDTVPQNAAEYFARHHYAWTNYHDADKTVWKAFKGLAIPTVILIDREGKIVYFDTGGDEAALRKAIAALGPEFAVVAPPAAEKADAASAPKP